MKGVSAGTTTAQDGEGDAAWLVQRVLRRPDARSCAQAAQGRRGNETALRCWVRAVRSWAGAPPLEQAGARMLATGNNPRSEHINLP